MRDYRLTVGPEAECLYEISVQVDKTGTDNIVGACDVNCHECFTAVVHHSAHSYPINRFTYLVVSGLGAFAVGCEYSDILKPKRQK